MSCLSLGSQYETCHVILNFCSLGVRDRDTEITQSVRLFWQHQCYGDIPEPAHPLHFLSLQLWPDRLEEEVAGICKIMYP